MLSGRSHEPQEEDDQHPGGEVVKRAVDAVVFAVVGRDEDPDARDPRRPLPNGTWAPPGKTETYRDLEDWLRQ
jgi:hypothetical protein